MYHSVDILICIFFFFNDTATTEIYTLSLHDALPIYGTRAPRVRLPAARHPCPAGRGRPHHRGRPAGGSVRKSRHEHRDRKSTRLNSSHANISYAVFCLKKKKYTNYILTTNSIAV